MKNRKSQQRKKNMRNVRAKKIQYLKFKKALDGFNRMDMTVQRVNFSTETGLIQYEEKRFSKVNTVLRTCGTMSEGLT